MANDSTNIDKRNNHLLPQIIEYIKKTIIQDIGNAGTGITMWLS